MIYCYRKGETEKFETAKMNFIYIYICKYDLSAVI